MALSYNWSALAIALADLKTLVSFDVLSRFSVLGAKDSELEVRVNSLYTSADSASTQLTAAVERVSSVEGGLAVQQTTLEGTMQSVAGLVSRIDGLESTDGGVLSRVAALEAVDESVVGRLDAAEVAKASAETRLASLEGVDGGVLARIDALESATAVSARLEALEAAINLLSTELSAYAVVKPPAEPTPPEEPPA